MLHKKAVTIIVTGVCFGFLITACHPPRISIPLPPPLPLPEPHVVVKPGKKNGPPPWAPAHGRRAKHRYRYYPDHQIYFDVGRRIYFYQGDSGWRKASRLPGGIHLGTRNYVILSMDDAAPYRHHGKVTGKYPPGRMKKRNKGKGKGRKKEHGHWK